MGNGVLIIQSAESNFPNLRLRPQFAIDRHARRSGAAAD